jgi:hypothetical protein
VLEVEGEAAATPIGRKSLRELGGRQFEEMVGAKMLVLADGALVEVVTEALDCEQVGRNGLNPLEARGAWGTLGVKGVCLGASAVVALPRPIALELAVIAELPLRGTADRQRAGACGAGGTTHNFLLDPSTRACEQLTASRRWGVPGFLQQLFKAAGWLLPPVVGVPLFTRPSAPWPLCLAASAASYIYNLTSADVGKSAPC